MNQNSKIDIANIENQESFMCGKADAFLHFANVASRRFAT